MLFCHDCGVLDEHRPYRFVFGVFRDAVTAQHAAASKRLRQQRLRGAAHRARRLSIDLADRQQKEREATDEYRNLPPSMLGSRDRPLETEAPGTAPPVSVPEKGSEVAGPRIISQLVSGARPRNESMEALPAATAVRTKIPFQRPSAGTGSDTSTHAAPLTAAKVAGKVSNLSESTPERLPTGDHPASSRPKNLAEVPTARSLKQLL